MKRTGCLFTSCGSTEYYDAEFLESRGEKCRPAAELDLPYHLDPDHRDVPEERVENGNDAAY